MAAQELETCGQAIKNDDENTRVCQKKTHLKTDSVTLGLQPRPPSASIRSLSAPAAARSLALITFVLLQLHLVVECTFYNASGSFVIM